MGITECQQQFIGMRWNCTFEEPAAVFGGALSISKYFRMEFF